MRPIWEDSILKTAFLGLTLALFLTPAFAGDYHPLDASKLPEPKRTKLGLYLSAPEAYKMKAEGGDKVLLIDVRTKGEFEFVGHPAVADQNIPYMEIDDPAGWDNKKNIYAMSPNSDFVSAVATLAARAQRRQDRRDHSDVPLRRPLLARHQPAAASRLHPGLFGDGRVRGRHEPRRPPRRQRLEERGPARTYKMTDSQAYLR